MPITETQPGVYSMPDKERSAFGLGYEYNRRGRTIEHNPFPTESQRFCWFRDGWNARQQIGLAKKVKEYHGEGI